MPPPRPAPAAGYAGYHAGARMASTRRQTGSAIELRQTPPSRWRNAVTAIRELNKDMLKDIDVIEVGMKLRLPRKQATTRGEKE